MAKDKNSFVLYTNYINVVNVLTTEQAGILFKLILDYVNDLNPEEPQDQAIKISWAIIKNQLKEDLIRWEDEREKRSQAGKKGMESRFNKKQQSITNDNSVIECYNKNNNVKKEITNITDNVNVNVNVNENDNVNDIDNINILNKENIYIDNVNKKNNVYTHDIYIELTNNIKEVFTDMSEESFNTFIDTFDYLLKKYTYKNVNISIRHAIDKTLENLDSIDNPLGYLRNAIYINCEQFKQ